MSDYTLHQGDCLRVLMDMPDSSVHCIVTSPPYFGLRDYGHHGQIGLEPTVGEYVLRLVAVFAECMRVLRDDGTLWLNLGDSYVNNPSTSDIPRSEQGNGSGVFRIPGEDHVQARRQAPNRATPLQQAGLKKKDLIGIPWRVAFALQSFGWYLRSDIIWHKPNPMPESVTDRPTKAHEYLFLLTKNARYYYDAEAIAEKAAGYERKGGTATYTANGFHTNGVGSRSLHQMANGTRNKRSVWTVATEPYPEAHFATYPTSLVEPCILAGCPVGGTVLDPFAGSGTTGVVAMRTGRKFIGIELNPEYVELAHRRLGKTQPALLAGD